MDTELFMECEEEELEPWQQVDDSVEEDDMEYTDNYGEPGGTKTLCCYQSRSGMTPGLVQTNNSCITCSTAPGPTQRVVTTATAAVPPRVVMSVEEFYYGRFSGDNLPVHRFTCASRLMQHVLHHSELVVESKERQCCRFCYRQFSSQSQLRDHQDQVHGSAQSTCLCRICEWAFDSEPAFLNHMKSNHKPGEMPYVCQVCSFRSSFYSDVVQHFATFHRETPFLLCVFCLKVMKNPGNYQQHLFRHKAFHCNRCRLQFTFLKDKMQHKVENHRSFRRPPQLEGLPPGSKVSLRWRQTAFFSPTESKPSRCSRSRRTPRCSKFPSLRPGGGWAAGSPAGEAAAPRPSCREQQRTRNRRSSVRFWSADRLVCLECGTDASDLTAHYPTYVHCLLCPYSSCCSRAYAAHMIHTFLLRCSECDFLPQTADQMAEHLLSNPEHDGATCCSRGEAAPRCTGPAQSPVQILVLLSDGVQWS
uniref:C2H2-type domain-containing protein n=1 Tax=Xiphophorus couchianus TaxID=32473 RepID=A0A3B5N1M3_9TELE